MDVPGAGKRKQVLLNGIEVGTYTSSGNAEADAELGRQLLISKGLWKPASRVRQMFGQAFAFCSASSDLWAKHLVKSPFNGAAVAPFVVNAAFSIELYLKTLLELEGTQLKKHLVLQLYDALTPARKSELERTAAQYAQEYKIALPIDFPSRLVSLNDAFERWRYVYESSSLKSVHINETIYVMRVLHETTQAALKQVP